FLHAIAENPGDDTVRLVYSDWLEENGQPERAAFIRLQCELEPLRFEIDRPRVEALLAQEAELLYRHGEVWLGPAVSAAREEQPPRYHPGIYGPYFRRGVPEVVAVSLDTLLHHGEKLLAAHPTIRELAVFDVQRRGSELAACEL